jgi:hypothetical protein
VASPAERDPSAQASDAPRAPIVAERKLGRNDLVTLVNPATGAREQMKYKLAQGKLAQGWQLLDEA